MVEYVVLEKAKPYIRTRKGKLERVSGYSTSRLKEIVRDEALKTRNPRRTWEKYSKDLTDIQKKALAISLLRIPIFDFLKKYKPKKEDWEGRRGRGERAKEKMVESWEKLHREEE